MAVAPAAIANDGVTVNVAEEGNGVFIGNWTIEHHAQGTRVDYVASAKPRIYLRIWGGSIMHDMVKGQLTNLKKEILRRPSTASNSVRRDTIAV